MNIIEKLFEPNEIPIAQYREYNLRQGYTLNRQGYRCDEFDKAGDIKVISIGCSITFGWAIATEERFSNVFARLLHNATGKSIVNWNLGEAGKSNDYIARQTLNAIRILKPDIVLICWTEIGRREYFSIDYNLEKPSYNCLPCLPSTQNSYNYLPSQPDHISRKSYAPQFLRYMQHLRGLTSPHEDLINAYKNIQIVNSALQAHQIPHLYLGTHSDLPQANDPVCVGDIEIVDKAKDDMHPGPQTNLQAGTKLFKRYKNVYMDP